MKKLIIKALSVFLVACTIIAYNPIINMTQTVEAHSGRTDSSGGHKDNNNKSGLGSYHYHCGGHPAHLHENSVCPYSPKDTISVSGYNPTMYVGDSDSFEYSITSVNSYVSPTISSSDTSVISVSGTTLSAKGSGTATISVTTSNATKIFTITVKEIIAVSLDASIKSDSVQIGDSLQITTSISPSNATNKKISYNSSDENIASVSSSGIIIGKSSGKVELEQPHCPICENTNIKKISLSKKQ